MTSIQNCDPFMPDAVQMRRYSTVLNMYKCVYVCKTNVYRNIVSLDK